MTFRFCQLFILSGCYGRVVQTQPLFQEKLEHLSTLRHALETNDRLIDKQLRQCDQFANPSVVNDSLLARQLSSIDEEDLSADHDQIIVAIKKKT